MRFGYFMMPMHPPGSDVGDTLQIAFGLAQQKTVFKGEITGIEERYGDGVPQLVLLAEDALGLLDALGIERMHLVGHSMGAYTALHVGIHHPDRCYSVVAAGCGWGSLADPAARAAMRAQAPTSMLPRIFAPAPSITPRWIFG